MSEESEIRSIATSIDADVDELTVFSLAERLRELRKANGQWGCMHKGGAGVGVWVKSRLQELKLLPPCLCLSESLDARICVLLHFYPWDAEKYGECFDTASTVFEELCSGVQRSPLMRLLDADPVDITASRVSQQINHVCLYCSKTFRNHNALSLHIKERHVR